MFVGWPRTVRGDFRRDHEAVSEVIGTVLLLAITVILAAAFALLLNQFAGPTDRAHADLDIRINPGSDGAWGTGNEEVVVRHMGGESLDGETTELIIRVGTSPEARFQGTTLFSNGSFQIGEELSLTFTISTGTTVDVLMISGKGGSSLIGANSINPGGVSVPGGIVYTYPTGEATPAHGTLDDFSGLTAAGGATGTYEEESVSTSGTETRTASASSSTGTTTTPDNARVSDNEYAILLTGGDTVRVSDWGATTGSITSVTAFLQSHFETTGSGGQTSDEIRFKYLDNGALVSSEDYSPTATDSTQSVILSAPGGSWDASEIQNLALEAEYILNNPEDKRDFYINAMWIEIETSGTVFSLESNLTFSGVPNGNQWLVEAEYAALLDEFRIEVRNAGGTWSACGTSLNSATITPWQGCTLTSGQYNSGSPTLRIVDATGSTSDQGTIEFDYVRIRTT